MNPLQLEEIWKDIPGFEGSYQVSNIGGVRSLDRRVEGRWSTPKFCKGTILKSAPDQSGYPHVNLSKFGTHTVHRLMMLAFFGKSELQVNHKNGVKADNRIENLEYVTCSENIIHAYDTRLNRHRTPVLQFTIGKEFIQEWDSMKEAGEFLRISKGAIGRTCRGEALTAGGFVWRYSI